MNHFQQFIDEARISAANNNAASFGVTIERNLQAAMTAVRYYKVEGVWHLPGHLNRGNHHVFVECLDEGWNIQRGWRLLWDWEGRLVTQVAWPIVADKPWNEAGCNVAMEKGQIVSVQIDESSDRVRGMHTGWDSDGEGNSRFHHSFYVLYREVSGGSDGDTKPNQPSQPGQPVEEPDHGGPVADNQPVFIKLSSPHVTKTLTITIIPLP